MRTVSSILSHPFWQKCLFNTHKGRVGDKIINIGSCFRTLCVISKSLHLILQTELPEVKMESKVIRCVFCKENLGIEAYEFFWLCCGACGILFPVLGGQIHAPCCESLNHCASREIPRHMNLMRQNWRQRDRLGTCGNRVQVMGRDVFLRP